jgi:hypothetical protein
MKEDNLARIQWLRSMIDEYRECISNWQQELDELLEQKEPVCELCNQSMGDSPFKYHQTCPQ